MRSEGSGFRIQGGVGMRPSAGFSRFPIMGHGYSRGFTLIELIVVIIIVVVMMGLFLNSMLFYVEQAEKTAMEEVAGAIQSALVMQYGQILTRGKPSDVPLLAQDNPMSWLQKKPRNYAGEFYDPTQIGRAHV